jgi:hypothetical protein
MMKITIMEGFILIQEFPIKHFIPLLLKWEAMPGKKQV